MHHLELTRHERRAPENAGTFTEVGEEVTLHDGATVFIRPVGRGDAPRLLAFFSQLSPESTFLRFLGSCRELPYEQVEHLAHADHRTQMALVATHKQYGEEYIVAVAHYEVIPADEPGLAEAAMVVADRYQNRGLGTLLAKQLAAYARAHGIRTFLAAFHHSNTRIRRIIRRSGLPTKSKVELGTVEIRVELETDPAH